MRRERLYLKDNVDACNLIQEFLEGMDAAEFLDSELHKAAILQKLSVIGEAAARISQAFREKYLQVEWSDVVAFRNIAVHEYFAVQWDIVWATAKDDVPALREQIQQILREEYLNGPE